MKPKVKNFKIHNFEFNLLGKNFRKFPKIFPNPNFISNSMKKENFHF